MPVPRLDEAPEAGSMPRGLPGLHPGDHMDESTFRETCARMPQGFRAELIDGVVHLPLEGVSADGKHRLRAGDRLDQATFHALYEQMPEGFKAELIGGVVNIPLAASEGHGEFHGWLASWLVVYRASTPGTRALMDTTSILGPKSEPQPDAALIVETHLGGQTDVRVIQGKNYRVGAPELIVEVAYSSLAHDRHQKLRDYQEAGVREYVIVAEHEARVEWLVLRDGRFEPLAAGDDGLLRSETFPGLWLDPAALRRGDIAGILEVLRHGLATPEHAEFATRLRAARPS